MPTYRCLICKTRVEYGGGVPGIYPFCSEHCRMVDLGLWFRAAYGIDQDLTPEEIAPRDRPSAFPANAASNA